MIVNYLDLFSGIGGFALGAYWAGFRCDNHYFSEIEKYPSELYQKRFPDAIALGDITKINGKELPHGEWIITGGFPCQDISAAGKGAGLDGARSGLWFEYARIIGELRPRFAIMENVGALTVRGIDRVLGSLAEIGYDAEWVDIRCSDLPGGAHKRERIWIMAYPKRSVGVTWEDRGVLLQNYGVSRKRQNEEIGSKNRIMPEMGKEGYSILDERAPSPESMRVANGIPETMDRLKGLGNSIVPQIAEMIFEAIMESEKEST